MKYHLSVTLDGYIAHPYWPERQRVIQITKESGMARARSSANRRKALEEYLRANSMTLAEYDALEAKAEEPFYRVNGPTSKILIPDLHVISMIVATCDTIRAANRPVPPDRVRSAIRVSAWETDRTKPDGVWERFAVVTAGTGAKLSNQRALRSNPYIGAIPGAKANPVHASGAIELDDDMVKPSVFVDALRWAGESIGIGASRKMGWGRFRISEFSAVK